MADLVDLLSGDSGEEPDPKEALFEENPFEDDELDTPEKVTEALTGAIVGTTLAGVANALHDPVRAWEFRNYVRHDIVLQAGEQALAVIRKQIAEGK